MLSLSLQHRAQGRRTDCSDPAYMPQGHSAVSISPEVARALREGTPVVALESTIIAHGMPFPQNLETAEAVEAVVRQQGAVPATCAVLEGRCCVGLSREQLHRLASGCALPYTD